MLPRKGCYKKHKRHLLPLLRQADRGGEVMGRGNGWNDEQFVGILIAFVVAMGIGLVLVILKDVGVLKGIIKCQ